MYAPEPNDTQFELTPAGTHLATCYRVIDLGTQAVSYKGETKHQHKIMISWELPEELMKDGRPFSVHARYTLSLHEKATLRKTLEGWRGVPFREEELKKGPNQFNIKNVLGKSCLINVVHAHSNEKDYANVASVSKLMKGQKGPEKTINEPIYISINADDWNSEAFSKLSDSIRAKIMQSPEYVIMANGHDTSADNGEYTEANPPPADPSDDIPF